MSEFNFSFDDVDSMINEAASGIDLSNYFSGSGQDFDFGSLDSSGFSFDSIDSMINDAALGLGDFDFGNIDIGGLDLPQDFNFDPSSLSNIDMSATDLDALLDSMGAQGIAGLDDVALGDAMALADMGDFGPLNTYGMTDQQLAFRDDLMKSGGQEMQITPDNLDSFDATMTDIMQNRGGFTSGYQTVGPDRIMVRDDGTGIGVRENGESFGLSVKDVGNLIKAGKLNTFDSGYNTATGGNKIAPGGGSSVVLNNGQKGTLTTSGKVIDTNTGKVIGTNSDVKTVVTQDGDGRTITTTPGSNVTGTRGTGVLPGKKQANMGALLPILLALLAMNKGGGGGGGGGKGAVIPGLTATQRQTPYAQQQRAPGYRPGQGGVNYFEQTQFTPRMAAGGGIGGLLSGPGDGVSDSIPAVIDGGMAGGGQPAKLARGEYILDARTVAAVGNGSTDAGAERLDKMRENILRDDRQTGVGEDSKAYRHLMA
jgi:hypothetical protein